MKFWKTFAYKKSIIIIKVKNQPFGLTFLYVSYLNFRLLL